MSFLYRFRSRISAFLVITLLFGLALSPAQVALARGTVAGPAPLLSLASGAVPAVHDDAGDDASDTSADKGEIGGADERDPADPDNPADLGHPADPGEPADPGDPADPDNPADPGDPADSGNPTSPGEPGELIVRYKAAQRFGLMAATPQLTGAETVAVGADNTQLLQADDIDAALAALRDDPNVAYVEPNYLLHAAAAPNDPHFAGQWGLDTIEATALWEAVLQALGGDLGAAAPVTVAVLDTGVDSGHEDLQGRLLPGQNVLTGAPDPADTADANGHGTHVAGIVAATADNGIGIAGVAGQFPVSVLPVKVLNDSGTGTVFDVAQGIRWAADNGADIINLSLGARLADYPVTLGEAVRYAQDKGVLVVAAAGNEGREMEGFYPASLPGVVSVGATDQDNKLVAGISNKGALVQAPGHAILSTLPGNEYGAATGTSAAAPAVSAIAALLWVGQPGKSAAEISFALENGQPFRSGGRVLVGTEAWLKLTGAGPRDYVSFIDPDGWATISGTYPLTVQADNPAAIHTLAFSALAEGADPGEEIPLGIVPGPAGGGSHGPLFTLPWDTTTVPDGTYTLYVESRDSAGNRLEGDVIGVIVDNGNLSALSLHVKKPDGTPAIGAPVLVLHPYIADGWDGPELVYEVVADTVTDSLGNVLLPYDMAPYGEDYLVLTWGSSPNFFYHKVVRTPANVTLDASDAAEVSIRAEKKDGSPLAGATVRAVVRLDSGLVAVDPFEVEQLPEWPALDGNGEAAVWLTHGRYDVSVFDAAAGYYLSARNALIDASRTDVALGAGPDDFVTITVQPEEPFTQATLELFRPDDPFLNLDIEQVLRLAAGPGTVLTVSPGDYEVLLIATAPMAGEADGTVLQWTSADVHTLAAGNRVWQVGGPFSVSMEANGPLHPGQYVEGDIVIVDAFGNTAWSLQSRKPGDPWPDFVEHELTITDSGGGEATGYYRAGATYFVWEIPADIAPGTYTATVEVTSGPLLHGAPGGGPLTASLALEVVAGDPWADAPIVIVRDRQGRPLPDTRVTVLEQVGPGYVPLESVDTDDEGLAWLGDIEWPAAGTFALAVTGMHASGPDGETEPFFVFQPLPPGKFGAEIDLSALNLQPVTLQARDEFDDPIDAGFHLYAYDAAGRWGGALVDETDGDLTVWLAPGEYAVQAAGVGEWFASYNLVQTGLNVVADAGPHAVTLGGADQIVTVELSDDVLWEANVLAFRTDAPGIPHIGRSRATVHVLPGSYWLEAVGWDGSGDWLAYWFAREFTLQADDGLVTWAVDTDFALDLSLDAAAYAPGDTVVATHAVTDSLGNRLIGIGLAVGPAADAQTHTEIAPILTITDSLDREIFRTKQAAVAEHEWDDRALRDGVLCHACAAGTYAGAEFALPHDAAGGQYTARLMLTTGPGGPLEAEPVVFHIHGRPGAPLLAPFAGPTNAAMATVAGTTAPDATVRVYVSVDGSPEALAGTTAADGDGSFAVNVALPDEGVYRFTAEAEVGGETGDRSAPVELIVDRTAPAPPAGLSAESPDDRHVRLTWDASPDADVALYRIERDGVAIADVAATEPHTYLDADLEPDTEYTYGVIAVDLAGNRSDAATVIITTSGPADMEPPTAPANLRVALTGRTATLSWDEATDNVAVAGYRIYRATDAEAPVLLDTVPADDPLAYADRDLPAGKAYRYTVTAYDAADNESEPSNEVTVATDPLVVASVTGRVAQVAPGVAAPGARLTVTATGTADALATAEIHYEHWLGGDRVAATATVDLTEALATPGAYQGSWVLPAGTAVVTQVQVSVSDGQSASDPVPAAGFPVTVAGAVTVTITVPGMDAVQLQKSLQNARVHAWSAAAGAGGSSAAVATGTDVGQLPAGDDYHVRLLGPQGEEWASAAGVSVQPGRSTAVALSPVLPATLRLTLHGRGSPIANVPLTVRRHGEIVPLAHVTTNEHGVVHVDGLQAGTALEVDLPQRLPFAAGTVAVPGTLSLGLNERTLDWPEYKGTMLTGTVIRDGAAVAGATVIVTQEVNGESVKHRLETDGNGEYFADVFPGPADVQAFMDGYRSDSRRVIVPAVGQPEPQALMLKRFGFGSLTLDIHTKYAGGEWAQIQDMDWRVAYHFYPSVIGPNGVPIALAQKTYPLIVGGAEGDEFTVCIDGRESQLPTACTTAALDEHLQAHAVFHLEQTGAQVDGTLIDSALGMPVTGWTGVLHRLDEPQVSHAVRGHGNRVRLMLPAAGRYRLDVQTAGAEPQRSASVEFTSVAGDEVRLGTIHLTPGGVFAGQPGNGVTASPRAVPPGGRLGVRVEYRNSSSEPVHDASVTFDVPPGTRLVPGSVTLNGEPAAVAAGNVVSLPTPLLAGEGGVLYYVLDVESHYTEPTLGAIARIHFNGNRSEMLGFALVDTEAVTIQGPSRVSKLQTKVSGQAPAGSIVSIYDNGELAATALAEAGFWHASVVLTGSVDKEHEHVLWAVAEDDETGDYLGSSAEPAVITYSPVKDVRAMVLKGSTSSAKSWEPEGEGAEFPYVFVPGEQMSVGVEFVNPGHVGNVEIAIEGVGTAAATQGPDGMYYAQFKMTNSPGNIYLNYDNNPAVMPFAFRPEQEEPGHEPVSYVLDEDSLNATDDERSGWVHPQGAPGQRIPFSFKVEPLPDFNPSAADLARVRAGGPPLYNLQRTITDDSFTVTVVIPNAAFVESDDMEGQLGFSLLFFSAGMGFGKWKHSSKGRKLNGLQQMLDQCRPAGAARHQGDFDLLARNAEADFAMRAIAATLGLGLAATGLGLPLSLGAAAVFGAMNFAFDAQWDSNYDKLKAQIEADPDCEDELEELKRMLAGSPHWILDPSGYVYEGLPENRLEGVTATIFGRSDAASPWTVWDAEWYLQQNPQQTDANGAYGWDVPPGDWLVGWTLDGYDPAFSDVITVPPIRTDVNQGLIAHDPPAVAAVRGLEAGQAIDVTFTQYMQAETLTDSTILVYVADDDDPGAEPLLVAGTVVPLAPKADPHLGPAAPLLTRTARFIPAEPLSVGETVTVVVRSAVQNYAGRPLPEDVIGIVTMPEDTTPPAPVTAVKAIPGDGRLTLTWQNPADADLGSIVITWDGWTPGSTVVAAPATTAAIPALINGFSYTLSLTAVDAHGNESAAVTVTGTPTDTTPPAAVTGAALLPDGAGLMVVWTDPADADFSHVRVAWQTQAGAAGAIRVGPGRQLFELPDVGDADDVAVTLTALDTAGNASVAVKLGAAAPGDGGSPGDGGAPGGGWPGGGLPGGSVSGGDADAAFEPVTATVTAAQGGTVAAADNRIRVVAPAGAVTGATRFTLAPVSAEAEPDAAPFVKVGDLMFQVLAETLAGEAVTEFGVPLQLIVQFTADDLAGIDRAALMMFYFDPALAEWIAIPTVFDESSLTLTATVDHLTVFAVLYAPDFPRQHDISGHWAEPDILKLLSLGLASGVGGGRFNPEGVITRAEFTKLLVDALGLAPQAAPKLTFADASAIPQWAAGYVATAVEAGIVHGLDGNRFGPGEQITREQMAVMLARALGLAGDAAPGSTGFRDDGDIADWARGAVQAAVSARIIAGMGDGTFAPEQRATRAQAARLMAQVLARRVAAD